MQGQPFVHDNDHCDVANTFLCPGAEVCGGAERADREADGFDLPDEEQI